MAMTLGPSRLSAIAIALSAGAILAQERLPGEFGDIRLGRDLIEPTRFPTIRELRQAVRSPRMTAVLTLRQYGDENNHYLPAWSSDGRRLAFQRSDKGATSSRLLVFTSLSEAEPTLLGGEERVYDFQFRWALESNRGYSFARIAGGGAARVRCSLAGEPSVARGGSGRHAHPEMYQRTDGIRRLVYEREGEIVHQALSEAGPLEDPVVLSRGTYPRWSPDGRRLLLMRPRRGAALDRYDVAIHDLRRGEEIALPVPPASAARSPEWSPVGDRVAMFLRDTGAGQPWRLMACSASRDADLHAYASDVVVNESFDSQGPAWQPDGQRLWFLSHARRRGAYYPLMAVDAESGQTTAVDYPQRLTGAGDLAINPESAVPEIALSASTGRTRDVFVVFLNHFGP